MASGHLLLSCAKRAATTKIDLFAYLWQLPCALCSLILMTLRLQGTAVFCGHPVCRGRESDHRGRHGRAAVGKADHRASGCFPARYARSVVRVFQHRRSAALFRADADAAFGRAMIHAGPKHAERRAAGPCRVIS